MKKTLFILVCTFGMVQMAFTQTELPNPDFENWSNEVYWEDPEPFTTTNLQAFISGNSGNANKSTDSHGGLYSCHLQTSGTELGNFPGALFIGTPSTDLVVGGLPFDGSPDSIRFFAKHHIAEGDSAVLYCILQNSDFPVALGFHSITGEETGWVQYSAPMEYIFALAPDMVSLILASSDFDNPNPESWIKIDDIQFVYNGVAADPFPGGDFEEWVEVGSEEPDMWNTSNPFTTPLGQSVQKSNQAFSGSYSVRIETLPTTFAEGENIGFMLNGLIGDDVINGGLELNDQEIPISFTGYYKYDPANETDSAGVLFLLREFNDITSEYDTLLEGELDLPAASTFTLFEIEMPMSILNDWIADGTYPDLLTIGFSSSKINDDDYIAPEGSVLWIDDLSLGYYLGVDENSAEESVFAFPNPASDRLDIQAKGIQEIYSVEVYDRNGALVRSLTQIKSGMMNPFLTLDVAALAEGNYTLLLETANGTISKKISVIH